MERERAILVAMMPIKSSKDDHKEATAYVPAGYLSEKQFVVLSPSRDLILTAHVICSESE